VTVQDSLDKWIRVRIIGGRISRAVCYAPEANEGLPMAENKLYYGDNLDILRRYIADESVDLIYLDPPFKSQQDYNVLFAERNGTASAAQIKAFEDTWTWDLTAEQAYYEVVEAGGRVSRLMQGMWSFLGGTDMMAYLAMMAPRLVELRRVLKPTGSIYLHCDPTASGYLRTLMDAVFAPQNLRTEIIWVRAAPRGHAFTRFPSTHDVILFYGNGGTPAWNPRYVPYRQEYIDSHYRSVEPDTGRRYQLGDCTNPNPNRPNLTYEWRGITKVWRWTREKMQVLDQEGRLVYTSSGMPRYKRYLDEMPGSPVTSVWTDIPHINSMARERLGYPTQKPEALLERIIQASSNEGETVLDPFCGCGTAVVAAQSLGRRWIGIDITHLAITLIKHRLHDKFEGTGVQLEYEVIGEPTDLESARMLAQEDPFQFELWALGLLNARPIEKKQRGDRGVDGRIYFHDEAEVARTKQIILQVKAGHTGPSHVRDLRGVVEREEAEIGVLITMRKPTKAMIGEAASAGFYEHPFTKKKYPRIQLLTIEELLDGKTIDYPPRVSSTFKKAPKAKTEGPKTKDMFEDEADDLPES